MTFIVKPTLQGESQIKNLHFKLIFSWFRDKVQSQITNQSKNKSPKIPDPMLTVKKVAKTPNLLFLNSETGIS